MVGVGAVNSSSWEFTWWSARSNYILISRAAKATVKCLERDWK